MDFDKRDHFQSNKKEIFTEILHKCTNYTFLRERLRQRIVYFIKFSTREGLKRNGRKFYQKR